MKHLAKFLLLILLNGNLLAQERFPLATQHYHLKLSFDFPNELLKGICQMSITNHADTAVSQLPLLLYRLMQVESVSDQQGKQLPFSQVITHYKEFPKLQLNSIMIDAEFQPGETKVIEIRYGGYLLGYAETGMRYITDRISPSFTLIRDDAYAFPKIGIPSIAFARANINLYEFTLEVTVPDTLMVASGGKLVSAEKHNTESTYRYTSKVPDFRMDIAIAPYNKLQSEGLNIFWFNSPEAASRILEQGQKTMELYTRWWGPLHNDNAITVIETGKGSGGQASETTILLPQEDFENTDARFLYHELSHLWHVRIREEKGVSPRWEEGLATFCEDLVPEITNRESQGQLSTSVNSIIRQLKRSLERTPRLQQIPMIEYGNRQLTQLSYIQPTIMFAVLYYWLGEDIFHQAIGGFYQRYSQSGASTPNFTDYWLEISGHENLRTFFNDWIYTADYAGLILSDMSLEDIVKHYQSIP